MRRRVKKGHAKVAYEVVFGHFRHFCSKERQFRATEVLEIVQNKRGPYRDNSA